uniref:Uncharacterized protein n=1 Tax=Trichuris muris TaxID=70415 RepID=A0A5S6Q7K3_TRIMR
MKETITGQMVNNISVSKRAENGYVAPLVGEIASGIRTQNLHQPLSNQERSRLDIEKAIRGNEAKKSSNKLRAKHAISWCGKLFERSRQEGIGQFTIRGEKISGGVEDSKRVYSWATLKHAMEHSREAASVNVDNGHRPRPLNHEGITKKKQMKSQEKHCDTETMKRIRKEKANQQQQQKEKQHQQRQKEKQKAKHHQQGQKKQHQKQNQKLQQAQKEKQKQKQERRKN